MTGTVTWEVLAWVVGLITAAGTAVAIFLFWVWRIVSDLQARFEKALDERDTAAGLERERAKLEEATLRREFNEYQIHVAEHYATKDGVSQAVGRVEAAIERLGTLLHETVDRLSTRLDRVLDNRE